MKLVDCSLFAWETDLLELRLRETADVVDRFIVLEARQTTRGVAREPVYPQVRDRYAPWAAKIQYEQVDMPGDAGTHPQRRFGMFRDLLGPLALGATSQPNDAILICDGDEIPRGDALAALRFSYAPHPFALGMAVYYYWVNCRFRSLGRDGPPGGHGALDGWPVWRGPAVVRRSTLEGITPNALREGPALPLWLGGGWHFSMLFSAEQIREKLLAQGHVEYDHPGKQSLANIEAALREGRDFDWDRNLPLEFVPIDDSYPRDIREHPERWQRWIGGGVTA